MTIAAASCNEPTRAEQDADGSLLIYSRRPQGDGLYLISRDGSSVRRLSPPALAVPIETRDFDWSPDGSRVAFFNGVQLYVADLAGGQPRQLTSGPAQTSRYPSWSPDGSMLAYATPEVTSWALIVVRADGSGQRRLDSSDLTSGGRPSWSPDGKRLVFAKDEIRFNSGNLQLITALYVTDVGSAIATRLASPGSCNDSDPAWSPDGTTIAFVGCRDAIAGIFTMRPDGTALRRVTTAPGNPDRYPSWSPDGTTIAFVGCRDAIGGIFTMRPDGTALRRVTTAPGNPDRYPSWSPAGDHLAFERGPAANRDVFTVALDGSDLVNLTASNQEFDGAPKWRKR